MSQAESARAAAVKSEELRAVAATLGGGLPPGAAPPATAPVGGRGADAGSDVGAEWSGNGCSIPAATVRLGEELPIFCERCGYALHGLPQQRCDRCSILQFVCPECGHRQPINTLRPAAQRIIGRVRAFVLGLWILFKLLFFGWLLFAWFAMGMEWSYAHYQSRNTSNANNWVSQVIPRPVDIEAMAAFLIFGLAFGMFGRMLLLRWGRAWAVGAVLAVLVLMASYGGAWVKANVDRPRGMVVLPVGADYQVLLIATGLTVVFAAMVAFPIWMALAHLFLPERTAVALINWQRSVASAAPALARQE